LELDDVPLFNFIKCQKGNYEFIRKGDSGTNEQDEIHWLDIYDQYIKEFGLGKLHTKMLEAMRKKALLQCDYVETRDSFKITLIEMQIVKLNGMLANAGSGITIEQTLIHLSKWMGHWINIKTIKAKEYFNLVREFERYNKESNGKKNNGK
jgi:hypothetical protein